MINSLLFKPYPVTKKSDLGLWKEYMLFPSFSTDFIHRSTCDVSMDWLTISVIVMNMWLLHDSE